MKRKKETYSVNFVCDIRSDIETNPDYQRLYVWGLSNKQLLIDTILRGYDVPKFYWQEKPNEQFDVIDGQQRLKTIWEFYDNKFKLPKNLDPIDDEIISEKYYKDLPLKIKKKFNAYNLDVIIVYEVTDEEEVRDMFQRLQNGVTLKAQEKRNAMSGNMRDFVISLSKHSFWNKVAFKDDRFVYHRISAQMTLYEITGGPTDLKSKNLDDLYKNNKDFDLNGNIAKKIKKTLDYLDKVFDEKTPELKTTYCILLYAMVSGLLDRFVITDMHKNIFNFFIDFEKFRRSELKKEDDKDQDIMEFQSRVVHGADAKSSIHWKLEHLLARFGVQYPKIETKDEKRNFSHEQRLSIWRRDNGICQIANKCDGSKLAWNDEWDADHIVPFKDGGKTIVENGRVTCASCNRSR